MRVFISICFVVFFVGCSFETPPNDWKYKSINSFDSYTKNFLSANDKVAQNDMKRAVKHAKRGVDFNTLASIYLGECALNISVGVDDICKKYLFISDIPEDKNRLDAYYHLIRMDLKKINIKYIDKNYKKFALCLKEKNYADAQKEIFKMPKSTSKLIASALIREKLDNATREKMFKIASFYGYKKSALFWLNEMKKYTKDEKELIKIKKKISIISSKSKLPLY